jgi:hypothetical protein
VFGTPTHGVAFTLEKYPGDLASLLAKTAPSQGYTKVTTTAGDLYIDATGTRVLFAAKGAYVHFDASTGAPRDVVISLATKLANAIIATQ